MPEPKKLSIKCTDELMQGTHGSEVIISTSDKDVSLTFIVPSITPGEALVTSRVFIPHSTALKMANIINQRLKPANDLFQKLTGLIPPTEDSAGEKEQK
jgi:hypothetical protein